MVLAARSGMPVATSVHTVAHDRPLPLRVVTVLCSVTQSVKVPPASALTERLTAIPLQLKPWGHWRTSTVWFGTKWLPVTSTDDPSAVSPDSITSDGKPETGNEGRLEGEGVGRVAVALGLGWTVMRSVES